EQGGGPRGTFTFNGSVTLPGTGSPNQFNNYAAFLLGLPQQISKTIQPDWSSPRQWMEGYYIRDRWQATRRLTLTLGVRWEYYPITTRVTDGIERYDPVSNNLMIGGFAGVPRNAGILPSNRDFAPRFGIAYRLRPGTVIRAGYGISIDPQLISVLLAYPAVVNGDFAGPNSFVPYGNIASGIPPILAPDITKGVVPMPATVTTTTIAPGPYRR